MMRLMNRGRVLKVLAGSGAALFAGAAAGWLAAPGPAVAYLELQSRSDMVHRFFLLAEPVLAMVFLLSAMLAVIFTEFTWPRRVFSSLWTTALFLGVALLVYVGGFEYRIEQKGMAGEWRILVPPEGQVRFGETSLAEDESGPGLSLAVAAGELALDRRSLFLRDRDGRVRWHRKRPGGFPARVLVGEGVVLLALPSDGYADDLQLLLFDTESGRLRWELHVLGRRARALLACSEQLVLLAERPGSVVLYLIDAGEARLSRDGWKAFPGPPRLSPRCWQGRLQLVANAPKGGEIFLELDPAGDQAAEPVPACQSPQVVCQKGRVHAWRDEP